MLTFCGDSLKAYEVKTTQNLVKRAIGYCLYANLSIVEAKFCHVLLEF
jgi:hypothetical protein